jgi:antitoxin (DNA-binding transcriptional repressor) of toxin-antitoxin stability system
MKSVRSDEIRRALPGLLSEVEHQGEHVTVLRYRTPAAVIVPIGWHRQAQAILADHRERCMNHPVTVTVAPPEEGAGGDAFPQARSVAWVATAAEIGDVSAFWTSGNAMGDLGWTPMQVRTGTWRINSTHTLRTVADVLVGWTTIEAGAKVQWYQWNGWTRRFEWTEDARRMPGGLPQANIALEQIRKAVLDGRGPEQSEPAAVPFGFGLHRVTE